MNHWLLGEEVQWRPDLVQEELHGLADALQETAAFIWRPVLQVLPLGNKRKKMLAVLSRSCHTLFVVVVVLH